MSDAARSCAVAAPPSSIDTSESQSAQRRAQCRSNNKRAIERACLTYLPPCRCRRIVILTAAAVFVTVDYIRTSLNFTGQVLLSISVLWSLLNMALIYTVPEFHHGNQRGWFARTKKLLLVFLLSLIFTFPLLCTGCNFVGVTPFIGRSHQASTIEFVKTPPTNSASILSGSADEPHNPNVKFVQVDGQQPLSGSVRGGAARPIATLLKPAPGGLVEAGIHPSAEVDSDDNADADDAPRPLSATISNEHSEDSDADDTPDAEDRLELAPSSPLTSHAPAHAAEEGALAPESEDHSTTTAAGAAADAALIGGQDHRSAHPGQHSPRHRASDHLAPAGGFVARVEAAPEGSREEGHPGEGPLEPAGASLPQGSIVPRKDASTAAAVRAGGGTLADPRSAHPGKHTPPHSAADHLPPPKGLEATIINNNDSHSDEAPAVPLDASVRGGADHSAAHPGMHLPAHVASNHLPPSAAAAAGAGGIEATVDHSHPHELRAIIQGGAPAATEALHSPAEATAPRPASAVIAGGAHPPHPASASASSAASAANATANATANANVPRPALARIAGGADHSDSHKGAHKPSVEATATTKAPPPPLPHHRHPHLGQNKKKLPKHIPAVAPNATAAAENSTVPSPPLAPAAASTASAASAASPAAAAAAATPRQGKRVGPLDAAPAALTAGNGTIVPPPAPTPAPAASAASTAATEAAGATTTRQGKAVSDLPGNNNKPGHFVDHLKGGSGGRGPHHQKGSSRARVEAAAAAEAAASKVAPMSPTPVAAAAAGVAGAPLVMDAHVRGGAQGPEQLGARVQGGAKGEAFRREPEAPARPAAAAAVAAGTSPAVAAIAPAAAPAPAVAVGGLNAIVQGGGAGTPRLGARTEGGAKGPVQLGARAHGAARLEPAAVVPSPVVAAIKKPTPALANEVAQPASVPVLPATMTKPSRLGALKQGLDARKLQKKKLPLTAGGAQAPAPASKPAV